MHSNLFQLMCIPFYMCQFSSYFKSMCQEMLKDIRSTFNILQS